VEPWVVGLVALLVVGVAVIVYGALADRAKNRRRAAAMLAPPQRSIPHLPADAAPPRYLSELQARRPPAGPPPTGSAAPAAVLEAATKVPAGYASRDFVTADGQAVLDDPVVLVCADPVATVRELLPVLEQVLQAGRPLALVAPELAPEVIGTLEVNVIQRKFALVAVVADEPVRTTIARVTGAEPVDRADRQSGYLTPERLGHVARWVSTRDATYLVEGPA
jgi:hypothetical protein